jgi:hypothetical protein
MVVSMKMTVFWAVVPCSVDDHCPGDGGSKYR